MPRLRQTPVTAGLIAVNVAVYIATSASYSLVLQGANVPYLVQQGQWYRLFTSMFIHFSIFHIGLNMISLLIVGRLIEPALGPWRYLALYLVAGLGGAVGSYLAATPNELSAGASGAIFGLFGAYFVLARRARANTSGIVTLIGVNLAYSFLVPGIDWHDHIGGLVIGAVVAAGYGLGRGRGRREELVVDVLTIVVVCVALGLLLLLPPAVINIG